MVVKVTVIAEIKLSLSFCITLLILHHHQTTYQYEQASPFSLKSLKPNVFIKTFERLLWTICQVFQMEITHLTE